MKPWVAFVAAATVVLASPQAALAASLSVDPARDCYREQDTVFLRAEGYTPNGWIEFFRGRKFVDRRQADSSGAFSGRLTLPGLKFSRKRLTYTATDMANRELTAQVTLLTTSISVKLEPEQGQPNRRLTIKACGFPTGRTLWAHISRKGGRASTARRIRIGRVRGACGEVRARRRLFKASTPPDVYRVQFDTFRRYRKYRRVAFDYDVRIFPPGRGRRDGKGNGSGNRNRKGNGNG